MFGSIVPVPPLQKQFKEFRDFNANLTLVQLIPEPQ